MRRTLQLGFCVLAAALTSGCLSEADRTVLSIDASGAVAGLIFLDRNGDAEFTPSTDVPAGGISFAVVRGQRDTVGTGTTNEAGLGVVSMVPVGSYRLLMDSVQLGDSLKAAEAAPNALVQQNDTTPVFVALQYPSRAVEEARASETGKLIAIEGVALNGWATFGDSTVHVADSTGAIRAVRVQGSAVAAGDSVRVVGRTGEVSGDPVLTDATVFVTASGGDLVPALVTTAQAASARAGTLAAGLVRITDAQVIDSRQMASGDLRVQVDDGSGVLQLLLDRQAGVTSEDPVVPGARIDATGVLVPIGGDKWQLKPRGTADFEVRIPTATIAEAREMVAGQVLAIEGVALNGWAVFGDGSVHVSDATGTIRVFQSTTAFVAAGDSVRFVGIADVCCGQPILSSLYAFNLGTAAAAPVPTAITTGGAANAMGGSLDAALVKVEATIDTVRTVASETHLVVDDGSGELIVVLDRDTGVRGEDYGAGDIVNVTGVLVPADAGLWVLKPRRGADLALD